MKLLTLHWFIVFVLSLPIAIGTIRDDMRRTSHFPPKKYEVPVFFTLYSLTVVGVVGYYVHLGILLYRKIPIDFWNVIGTVCMIAVTIFYALVTRAIWRR